MRCPTCGEILEPGSSRCPTCGAAVAVPGVALESLHRCPRCSYTGRGMPYFRRPGHVALLVGVSLFTQGIGGLIYWLLRRNHRICPRCGLGWEQAYPLVGGGRAPARDTAAAAAEANGHAFASGGIKRRALGTLLMLIAGIFIVAGIAEFEPGAILAGSMIGASGSGIFFWGWRSQQERRQAIMAGLQQQVLRLATRRGGTLTVTEVASDLNLSIQAAEKVLIEMDDGFRVRSDVTPEGILLFEFPEVQHRPRLDPGADSG